MSYVILLDACPIGLVTNPNRSAQSLACTQWLQTLVSAGNRIIIPEIADYEVRRELLRANKTKRLFEKFFTVTLGTFRSPLTPLKKGGTGIKVPLFKGDLGGSKTFDTDKRTFQTSSKGIARLDELAQLLEYLSITTVAMRQAAIFWAQARQQGQPTAGDKTIDGDIILVAQAVTLAVPDVVIATTNVGHLSRFVAADLWQNIQAT